MKNILAVALLAIIVEAPVFAADSGFYIVGSVGSTSNIQDVDTAFSYGALVGYQFNRNFGVEGGYISLGSKAKIKNLPADTSGDISITGLAVAGTYTYPISDQFSILGRLGFSNLKAKANATANGFNFSASDTSSGVLYGAAGQFNLNNNLALRAGIDWYKQTSNGSSGTAINPNVSVVYKF